MKSSGSNQVSSKRFYPQWLWINKRWTFKHPLLSLFQLFHSV